jgi:hypothetical protein
MEKSKDLIEERLSARMRMAEREHIASAIAKYPYGRA